MPLELRGISHTYDGRRWILADVDLVLEPGTATAIVGPSGSGKSTLLAITGGLLRPTRGEVLVTAAAQARQAAVPVRTAWVFQTMNLLPRRSVLENVALGRLAIGGSRREAADAARQAIAAVGLAGLEDRLCFSLSGGEQQRVCIGRALVAKPAVILADEPTGNLDRSTSIEIAHLLLNARPAETALLIATHDLSVAQLCDRVLALCDGKLEAER